MKPWRAGLLASVVLLCVCPLVGRTFLPRETTSVSKRMVREEADPKDTESCRAMGELDLSYSSGNDGEPGIGLVVSDPRGRMIGQDPLSHKLWQELPAAQAFIDCDADEDTGATRSCRGSVQICGPVSGTYKVEVIASKNGRYSVKADGVSAQLVAAKHLQSTDSEADISDAPIQKGTREILLLTYSREPGSKVSFIKGEAPSVAGNR